MAPVTVVTGCSTGIGLELALILAENGYTVVATLRKLSAAPELLLARCDVQELDVTDDSSAKALTSYLETKYNGCDVLINNAGWGIPGTIETVDIEHAKQVFDVNVWGAVRMTQYIIPLMRARGSGLIVTVSSTSGFRGLPCSDVYTGSKFAIEGIMESFRYSLLKDNIKVCIVNPGPTQTAFSKRFGEELKMRKEAPEKVKRLVRAYVEKLEKRNAYGQTAKECAERIMDVVKRESKGGAGKFWNPTSEFGDNILNGVKVTGDGVSGPVYAEVFEQALKVWEEIGEE